MELTEAIRMHDAGELTTDQFTEIVKENQQRGIFWIPNGKNESRFGFLHHHVFDIKGQFFQNTLKKHILKVIDRIHSGGLAESDINHLRIAITTIHFSWRRLYDKDAFVYSDPRLKALDKYLKSYIASHIADEVPYNHELLFKIVDISLGMAKEDSYYRARLVDFADSFRKAHPDLGEYCDIGTISQSIRNYLNMNFIEQRKNQFMRQLVDVVIGKSGSNTMITDFVDDYRKKFPDMLIAPGERDNILRWH